jgi:hypothetical protein
MGVLLLMPANAERPETEYLYHYQRFDRKDDPRRFVNTLTKGQIYCSNPLRFNDPWDGKPYLRAEDVDDPKGVEEIARYFESVAQPPMRDAPHDLAKRRALRNPAFLKQLLALSNPNLANEIGRTYRVYCLSPFPDINLMWSHYANGHTGVCLQFSRKNPIFATAQKVVYAEKLPRYRIDAGEDEAQFMLQTKSDEWKYEQEYRLIARAGEAAEDPANRLLVTRKNYLALEREWLVSVIAGCRAPVDEIRELVAKHAPGLPVKQAVKSPDSYRPSVEDLL